MIPRRPNPAPLAAPTREPQSSAWRLVLAWYAVAAILVYLVAAEAVFRWRHPWMTQDERTVYVGRMLTWQTVDYSAARPQ